MLTRAQRQVGRIVLELVQEYGSVLAGGAAMNEAELIDRPTNDVDFSRTKTGKDVPVQFFIQQTDQRYLFPDIRDRAHAEEILVAFVGVDDKNQLLDNPDLIP